MARNGERLMSKQAGPDENKKYKTDQWSINSAEREKDACHPGRRRAGRVLDKHYEISVLKNIT